MAFLLSEKDHKPDVEAEGKAKGKRTETRAKEAKPFCACKMEKTKPIYE